MASIDKKALALTIQYLDDIVEKRIESRLRELESLVESSSLVLREEDGLTIIEGPEGPRGPRGFRGPEGDMGPAGEAADPTEVARQLRIDEDFVQKVIGPKGDKGEDGRSVLPEEVIQELLANEQFLSSAVGPQGPAGKDGKDGKDINESRVVNRLKRSKTFKEAVKGSKGDLGEQGPAGPEGVGLEKLSLSQDGVLEYFKTDGSHDVAGKIVLPESMQEDLVKSEIAKIKDEIKRLRSDVTAQITRAVMAAGGSSSGGGEVNIKFMDDFDLKSLEQGDGPVMWDAEMGKFRVGTYPSQSGIQILSDKINPYLIGDGTVAKIPKINTLTGSQLYAVYVIDPATDEAVSVVNMHADQYYLSDEYYQIESTTSLFNYDLYMAYVQYSVGQEPEYLMIPSNTYISADGLRIEVPFVDFNIISIESVALRTADGYAVDAITYIESDKLVFTSNSPMFGMEIDLFANTRIGQGTSVQDIPLSGLSHTVDFASQGILQIYNHMVLDSSTGEIIETPVFLTMNDIRIESTFDMTGKTLRLWYNPI